MYGCYTNQKGKLAEYLSNNDWRLISGRVSMIHWTMPVWRITRKIHWSGQHAMMENSRVRRCYTLLLKQRELCEAQWPWKAMWKSKLPLIVACFGWVAAKACLTKGTCRREELPLDCYLFLKKKKERNYP